MTVKCLNDYEKNQVLVQFQEGATQQDIARQWEVSRSTVQRVLIEAGAIAPRGAGKPGNAVRVVPKLSDEDRKILALVRHYKLNAESLARALSSPALTSNNIVQVMGRLPNDKLLSALTAIRQVRKQHEGMNAAQS